MREFRPILFLLLFVGGVFCLPPDAMYALRQVALAATTYYVQTDGNNANAGTSTGAANAWADPGYAASVMGDGDWCYVKTGTYTLTTTTPGAGGPVYLPTNVRCVMLGYETTPGDGCPTGNRPLIDVGATAPTTLVYLNSGDNETQVFAHFSLDGNDVTTNGVFGDKNNGVSLNVLATDFTYGFKSSFSFSCKAVSCGDGFSESNTTFCIATSCKNGWDAYASSVLFCIAYSNTQAGFVNIGRSVINNCLAIGNGTHGFSTRSNLSGVVFTNCVSIDNGGYGFLLQTDSENLINCAYPGTGATSIANASGNIYGTPQVEVGTVTLTYNGDPFVNSAGRDFRPNDTAGGGALLRAAGLGVYEQTNSIDIGAVQHADPAASGGETSHVWVR